MEDIKMKELIKDKIKKSLLELRKNKKIIILLLMVLIGVCYYFYDRSFGYFVNIKVNHILPKGRYIRGLYKTGDFYTMVDDYNDIYAVNINKNMRMSLIEKDISQRIGFPKLTKSVSASEERFKPSVYSIAHKQLENGNILFSIVDLEGVLNIYVYEPLQKKIIQNYKVSEKRHRIAGNLLYPLSNGSCLLYSQSEKRDSILEIYNSDNNSLTKIKHPDIAWASPFQKLSNGIYLFEYYNEDYYYLYFEKNNEFIKRENFVKKDLKKYFNVKAQYCGTMLPLGEDKYFVFCSHYIPLWFYSLQYKWNSTTQKFEYLLGKTYYIKEPKNINPLAHHPCGPEVRLSESEYLILGGGYSILIYSWPSTRSYIYNVDKGALRRIKPLKKILYTKFSNAADIQAFGSIRIDDNNLIYYVDNLVQGFKRSRVW